MYFQLLNVHSAMLGHLVKYTLSASEFVNATAELGFIEALAQGVVLVSEDLEPGSKEGEDQSLTFHHPN